ncbi:MAG: antitoxin VapB family protein [Nanoarchaeota archaeon]|nr:antitoxin VapB family protein [Nanoarchaeota archaeon]MBU1623258.1 antitoxin VapB family protein [Nanoarchaeota archaeon]MBU1974306.1 antitoxin VapB family protein [Nanoarchaeota archaeon]
MGTKTITIMDDAYDMLNVLKVPGESFSDEIRRLTKTKGSIMEFAGAWSDISEKEAAKMKARIRIRRKERSRLDDIHRKMKNVR